MGRIEYYDRGADFKINGGDHG